MFSANAEQIELIYPSVSYHAGRQVGSSYQKYSTICVEKWWYHMSLVPYVIEQTNRGERSYDIFSRLLNDRIVMLTDEVNNTTASLVVKQAKSMGIMIRILIL